MVNKRRKKKVEENIPFIQSYLYYNKQSVNMYLFLLTNNAQQKKLCVSERFLLS